jgi:catechol 2,3-dioxygenase-like lactoylglutathione lyase family enzyme
MKMKNPTKSIFGIHHVTAISSDPQRNIDFYTNNLGLRLVKQTVNHDDPATYLKNAGAEVLLSWQEGDHELTMEEIRKAKECLLSLYSSSDSS